MDNQEMQFADPEWQPRKDSLYAPGQEPEPYIPQPINRDPREQPRQQTIAPPQQLPYAGYAPAPLTSSQYVQPRRRSRSPWLWIVAIIIVVSLLSSAANRAFVNTGGPQFSFPHNAPPISFAVSGQPTVIINDNLGDINVHVGDTNQVTFSVDGSDRGFVKPQVNGDTITANVDNRFGSQTDLDVTVPSDANLQLTSDTGHITVDGVTGKILLQDGAGDIDVTNASLTDGSVLRTDAGAITFSGSVASTGNYQFLTDAGTINVTLPTNGPFHVDASTDAGAINSDFPQVSVQQNGLLSHQAQGDVGTSPQATVTLKSNAGEIDLHQGS